MNFFDKIFVVAVFINRILNQSLFVNTNQVSFIQRRILTECYFNDSNSCEVVKILLMVHDYKILT